jgi:hypothetical protein
MCVDHGRGHIAVARKLLYRLRTSMPELVNDLVIEMQVADHMRAGDGIRLIV